MRPDAKYGRVWTKYTRWDRGEKTHVKTPTNTPSAHRNLELRIDRLQQEAQETWDNEHAAVPTAAITGG
jgi:hypothetical protein